MKTLFSLMVATLLWVVATAQVSDPYLKVIYNGYSNGSYLFTMKSLQTSCSPDVSMNWSSDITVTKVNPNNTGSVHSVQLADGTVSVKITGNYSPNAVFYFKVLTVCQWKGSNPTTLTVNTQANLPVTFTGPPKIVSIDGNQAVIQFNVANQIGMYIYRIKLSTDLGKTWQIVTVVPANKESGYTYQATIKLQ